MRLENLQPSAGVSMGDMQRLIIVDDEADMLELYRHFFRKESSEKKFEVICFTSAEDCLDFLKDKKSSSGQILLISDINMPGMTGFDLLGKVKIDFPEMTVWMASAYSAEMYKQKAIDQGAESYIEKPIDFRSLKAAILAKIA